MNNLYWVTVLHVVELYFLLKNKCSFRPIKNDKILNDTSKKKKKACGFCSVVEHITTSCPTKMNFGKIINGDEFIFYQKINVLLEQLKWRG